jgi:HD-GYP domain-containing protein (c-di-GMP phosphodiesterase class II)
MQSATARLSNRLPVTPQRQALTVILYSEDDTRRAAMLSSISASAEFESNIDQVIEVSSPDQTGHFTLRHGALIVLDTGSAPMDPQVLRDRGPSAVVTTWGARNPDVRADLHVAGAPEPADVADTLRQARELAWLRSRAFREGATASSADKLARLNRIGTALSDVRALKELLGVVLTEARNIMDADAGSIYIIERGRGGGSSLSGRKVLGRVERRTNAVAVKRADAGTQQLRMRFAAAQNDSVEIPFEEIVFPANIESIAGYAAITGEIIALDDVHVPPEGAPYRFNKSIDEKYGYRTVSMLTVPLKNTLDEVVGIVQLINKKHDPLKRLEASESAQVIPFSDEDIELAMSLGSQAGVAIENVRLMDAISHLFERFVIACIQAVEQRDPATAGHSGRVDRLTMSLAEEVNRDSTGAFKDLTLSDAELVELHYAALLHDFGKIGVREHVLTKAEKLYPAQAQAILFRSEVIRRELRLDSLEREARLFAEGKPADAVLQELRQHLAAKLEKLDDEVEFVRQHIKPVFLTDEAQARLDSIYQNPWRIGEDDYPLIDEAEYKSLCTKRGTLNPEERKEIENHVAASWKFLKQIPWTEDLARVPEIAGQHHEKMKGGGYPNGVPAADTPLGSRLIAVADVFDSLTASDRPYKPAIPLERALQILQSMADEGDLDPQVVALFQQTRVWEKLKLKVVRMADASESQKAAR